MYNTFLPLCRGKNIFERPVVHIWPYCRRINNYIIFCRFGDMTAFLVFDQRWKSKGNLAAEVALEVLTSLNFFYVYIRWCIIFVALCFRLYEKMIEELEDAYVWLLTFCVGCFLQIKLLFTLRLGQLHL